MWLELLWVILAVRVFVTTSLRIAASDHFFKLKYRDEQNSVTGP